MGSHKYVSPQSRFLSSRRDTSGIRLQIWDVHTQKMTMELSGHTSRVGCLAWNGDLVCSGSRDRHIIQRDIRQPHSTEKKMSAHRQEVRAKTNVSCKTERPGYWPLFFGDFKSSSLVKKAYASEVASGALVAMKSWL